MMKVPLRMPKNSDDITSFTKRAITMAMSGGSIESHSGISPDTGKIYSKMTIKMIIRGIRSQKRFFIS